MSANYVVPKGTLSIGLRSIASDPDASVIIATAASLAPASASTTNVTQSGLPSNGSSSAAPFNLTSSASSALPSGSTTLNPTRFYQLCAPSVATNFLLTVTAEDGVAQSVFNLSVTRELGRLSTLRALAISIDGTTTSFVDQQDAAVLQAPGVPAGTDSALLSWTADDIDATSEFSADGVRWAAQPNATVTLQTSTNLFYLRVTPQDGSLPATTYNLSVSVPVAGTELGQLTAFPGLLRPAFSPSIYSYTLVLPSNAAASTIAATAAPANSTIALDGSTPRAANATFDVAADGEPVTISVALGDDSATATYTVTPRHLQPFEMTPYLDFRANASEAVSGDTLSFSIGANCTRYAAAFGGDAYNCAELSGLALQLVLVAVDTGTVVETRVESAPGQGPFTFAPQLAGTFAVHARPSACVRQPEVCSGETYQPLTLPQVRFRGF